MKNIPAQEKELMLFYWDLGIKPSVIAIIFKRSETIVRSILKANNRTGPQPTPTQALNTWRFLYQDIGEPIIQYLSPDDQEIKKLREENSVLKEKNAQFTKALQEANDREENQKQELEKTKEELTQEKKDKEDLTQQVTQLTSEKETRDLEKEALEKTVNEQKDAIEKMKQDHRKELEQQKTTIEGKINHEISEKQKKLLEIGDGLKTTFTNLENENTRLKENLKITTKERDTFKNEARSLKIKQKDTLIKIVGAGGAGALGGLGLGWWIWGRNNTQTLPANSGYRTNTGIPVRPIPSTPVIPCDVQRNSSGIITNMTISSGFNFSGIYPNVLGTNQRPESSRSPYQQNDVLPDSQATSGDVTISTYTSGTIQTSGVIIYNHIETMNLPQTISSHYIPLPLNSPVYFYQPFYLVPDELKGPCGLIPIKKMSGIQFQILIKWIAPQIGLTVLWMKTGNDKGGDHCFKNINNETIIAQVKQQQENIGIDAIYATHAAQDHYKTDKALIIITSHFTRPAKELAKEFHIDLWDWDRLCLELRNHCIFYPLE